MLFFRLKGTLQRNNPVKYEMLPCTVFGIAAEISVSYKLVAVVCLTSFQGSLKLTVF